MSYDANLLIAEDGVLARLAPVATKKIHAETPESGPKEDDSGIPSTGGSRRSKRKGMYMVQSRI